MRLVKRICIFLMMFWSVGFVLTLAVQIFAHTLFDIQFRKIEAGEPIAMQASDRLNVYIAALDKVPDVEALQPQVIVSGTDAEGLSIEPFAFKLTRPGEDDQPVYAHGLYSIVANSPQELTVTWSNPQAGYFLATSDSLMLSTVAFFSLIFFSLIGAALLYKLFGGRVLKRLTITQPDSGSDAR